MSAFLTSSAGEGRPSPTSASPVACREALMGRKEEIGFTWRLSPCGVSLMRSKASAKLCSTRA